MCLHQYVLLVPVHVHGSQVDVYVMINYIKLYNWKYESSVHCFEKKTFGYLLKVGSFITYIHRFGGTSLVSAVEFCCDIRDCCTIDRS